MPKITKQQVIDAIYNTYKQSPTVTPTIANTLAVRVANELFPDPFKPPTFVEPGWHPTFRTDAHGTMGNYSFYIWEINFSGVKYFVTYISKDNYENIQTKWFKSATARMDFIVQLMKENN